MYPGKDDLNEAVQLLSIGQKDDARRRLREIVRRRPSFLQAWKILADNAENPRERSEAIRRAQLLAPGDSWVVEAKKHRMPPANAPFANPLGGPPAIPAAPRPADVTVVSSRSARPEPPAAAARVNYDEPTIERPLSATERARYLGERIPDPEPEPPAPASPPTQPGLPRYTSADESTTEKFAAQRPPEDPYTVPPPTPPTSVRRRPSGEESTDEFTFISAAKPPADPEPVPSETPAIGQHGTLPYIPREDLDDALTRANTSPAAPQPGLETTTESLDPSDVGLTIRSTRLSELDAYAERLADDQPPPTIQRRFTAAADPDDDHLALTVATRPISANAVTADGAPELDENGEPTMVAPWMIIAVAGLGVFGCLLLIAAFATTLVGG